jgi:hypothetical protein
MQKRDAAGEVAVERPRHLGLPLGAARPGALVRGLGCQRQEQPADERMARADLPLVFGAAAGAYAAGARAGLADYEPLPVIPLGHHQ